MSPIEKLSDFLAHAAAKDLPLAELLALKADAFKAMAIEQATEWHDYRLAQATATAAVHARRAARRAECA